MKKDQILQALLFDGNVRLYAITARGMVEEAQRIHGLSFVCTAALGRQLMATAMIAAQLKNNGESLTTMIKGDGPAGNIVCTGRYGAIVKGYVANPSVELPLSEAGKLDVAGAVGRAGKLTVIKDLSMKEPYVGICNLLSGEIAEDFAQYFTVSEQTPSLVYLGVRINSDGQVLSAGGLIAQPLPGCPEGVVDALQDCAKDIANLTHMLETSTLAEALQALFEGMGLDIKEGIEPVLSCDCSRTRTEKALIALGREELLDMLHQDEGAELTCQFCNAAYRFTGDDLKNLMDEAGRD